VKHIAPELMLLSSVAVAIVAEDGKLLEANTCFMKIISEDGNAVMGSQVAEYFIQPNFATLLNERAGVDGKIYSGLLTIGQYSELTRSFNAQIWRDETLLQVWAEYDLEEMESVDDTLFDLNRDYANAQLELARTNFKMKQVIFDLEQRERALQEAGAQLQTALATSQLTTLRLAAEIKAHQQTEKSLKMMRFCVDRAGDSIFWINREGRILYVNEAACSKRGYSREELLAMTIFDLDPDYQPEVWTRHFEDLLQHGAITLETRHRTRAGTIYPVEFISNYVNSGEQEFNFCFFHDITDRKEHEKELLRSNAEMEQFGYAVSHDLRQPLRMVSSYLQLLEMNLGAQLVGETRDYIDIAIDGAKRIDQMLSALLDYSRVGRMGEPSQWIESRALLDEALKFLQPAIAEAQAIVTINGDWQKLFVSRDEMVRLFQNLVGNAIKYRIAGRVPEIALTGKTTNKEWHLCVADNGIGILPSQIFRLFNVFQRLQTRDAYEGTGIGLALCRKIVEHHEGRIWAESNGEGLGSRFYVVLPVRGDEKS
jgi:PAS domain S-box-containing protein